jgi:dTMP kinase
MSRGLFISFEGIDGVGKSTQVRLLAEHLGEAGRSVFLTREPGGTALGDSIRELLLHSKGHIDDRAEALLYAADRAQHVALEVEPALASGKDVITDRYLDSSVAYQGAGRDLGADEVRALSMFAVKGLLPNLTVLLDLSAEQAATRLAGTELDRLESEKAEFFEAVRQGFLSLAAAEPDRWLVLDASLPAQDIAAAIRIRVASLLQK